MSMTEERNPMEGWYWEVQTQNSPAPRLVLWDRPNNVFHATYLEYDPAVFDEDESLDLRSKVFWATTSIFVTELLCRALGIEMPSLGVERG